MSQGPEDIGKLQGASLGAVDEHADDVSVQVQSDEATEQSGDEPVALAVVVPDTNYAIRDRASFEALTRGTKAVAGLYLFDRLDLLIEAATLIATDFFSRPEFYKGVTDYAIVRAIAELHSRAGADEHFPSDTQRSATFGPIFHDTNGDFDNDRDALLSAVATFSEWGQPTGIQMLREAIRTTHSNFQTQLSLFTGASIDWSREEAVGRLANTIAYPILRDAGVTAVFGIPTAPQEDWPYIEDASGDQLVEAVFRRLQPLADPPITRHGFRLFQRSALRGAEALATVIDFSSSSSSSDLDRMITRCYTWYAALKGATGAAARVGTAAAPHNGAASQPDARLLGPAAFMPAAEGSR